MSSTVPNPQLPSPASGTYSQRTTRYSLPLQSYFRSGWAFLIPYLAAYLIYAWLKWPVNPTPIGEGMTKGISESRSVVSGPWSLVPSLLHIYWTLHAIHLILGVSALRARWRERISNLGSTSGLSSQVSSFYPLLPWLCLALLFWIPGLYLEWPSDPWEHLRRINEWHILDEVTAHSSWTKSSYFLPYSLTGHTTGLSQLSWLNLYYTATCLLLSWQYYRLARAVGLGERASMIFVILQALLMGNNVFSFYRYYGLSSTIFAQLGAVALTRVVLEASSPSKHQIPEPSPQSYLQLATRYSLLRLGGAVVLLLPLIAFNHIQGIGIAGLGILAVIVWRLIEWKRVMLGWLVLLAALASVATVWWFPRHPAITEIYRPQGWLNAWYGFNLFSPASIAFERSLHILGAFGVLNLILALWIIIRKNNVAGWLTLMPVIALALPCFALPFAHVLASQTNPENVVTFHRMLFALPMGLALVAALSHVSSTYTPAAHHDAAVSPPFLGLSLPMGYSLLCIVLAGTVIPPPRSSSFNRFWHSLQVSPEDLELRHFTAAWTPEARALAAQNNALILSHPLGDKVHEVFAPTLDRKHSRQINAPLATVELEQRLNWISALAPFDSIAPAERTQNGMLFVQRNSTSRKPLLIANLTASNTLWLRLGGRTAEHTFADGQLILSNPVGSSSHVFSPDLIPIERGKRYLLTSTVRQTGVSVTSNYLAVAWYDLKGRLLASHAPQADGSGAPVGWVNSTYSYYGLANQPAPADWTPYSIAFGLGEPAAIPVNAAYLRAGALLNFRSVSNAVVGLTGVILQEKPPYDTLLLALPTAQSLFTSASLAARLSRHWSPQNVLIEHGGSEELQRTAFSANHH